MRMTLEINRSTPPADLIAALEREQARNHELVEQMRAAADQLAEGRATIEAMGNVLTERTIERDHARDDAHLTSLCLAYLVHAGEVTSLPADEVNGMVGYMLSAEQIDGRLYLSIEERPHASEEGQRG